MKNSKINIIIRIPDRIHKQMLSDLRRSHPFAYERVGFLFTNTSQLKTSTTLEITLLVQK